MNNSAPDSGELVTDFSPRPAYWPVFFLSACTLALELAFTRVLSAVFYGNFAFLAITGAMLGVSLGGILVYIEFNNLDRRRLNILQQMSALCFVLSTLISLGIFLVLHTLPLTLTITLAFYAVAIPITFSSICLTLQFTQHSEHIGGLYAADLFGAGIGVFFAIIFLNIVSIEGTLLLVAAIAMLPLLMFTNRHRQKKFVVGFLLFLILLATINEQRSFLVIGDQKSRLSETLFTRSNSFSKITVGKTSSEENVLMLEIDADANTLIVPPDLADEGIGGGPGYIGSLPYELSQTGNHALIIGPGGGVDVRAALRHDMKVTGVEINSIIATDVMRDKFADFSGNLYTHPDVKIIVAEGRSYIHQSSEQYDVIQLSLVDSWAAAAAGAFTLSENNLYTVEAFIDYLDHLKPTGMLSVTRWDMDAFRLAVLVAEALARIGQTEPENHLVITQDRDSPALYHFLIKKDPFTADELEAIGNFTVKYGHTTVYSSQKTSNEKFHKIITGSNLEQTIRDFPIDIRLSTDDRPYFFNQIKLRDFFRPYIPYAKNNNNRLLWILLVTLVFTLSLIAIPIVRGHHQKRLNIKDLPYIGYFCFIGLGFMLLEIVAIQQFILFLEHPIYSYSVVLISMLIGTGLGSFVSQNIKTSSRWKYLFWSLVGIVVIALVYRQWLPFVVLSTITQSLAIKITIATLVVLPISFVMGQAFPLGIALANMTGRKQVIPWLWAVNGAASVLASAFAIFLAIYFGFSNIYLVGALCYTGAALAVAFGLRPTQVHSTSLDI